MAIQEGILVKSGSWISYNDEKIAQGRDKALQYLQDNPEVAEEIKQKVLQKVQEEMVD